MERLYCIKDCECWNSIYQFKSGNFYYINNSYSSNKAYWLQESCDPFNIEKSGITTNINCFITEIEYRNIIIKKILE